MNAPEDGRTNGGTAAPQFRFAPVPDSDDARRFLELSGYAGADLTIALDSLNAALRQEADGDPENIARYLIEFGVIAYCRAFSVSKVRPSLDTLDLIPADSLQLHSEVRSFRNTTVAHSQSELSTTWPMVLIDESDEPFIRDIQATTIAQTLPLPRVRALITLIESLIDALDELIDPVRARLLADARSRPLPESPQTLPGLSFQPDTAFKPNTRRERYPKNQSLYLSPSELSGPDDAQQSPWTRSALEAAGFEGFVAWQDFTPDSAPIDPGVYLVLHAGPPTPRFLDASGAGWRKGRNPSATREALEAAWVPTAEVLYIGKANAGTSGKRGLRKRLNEYRQHGRGRGGHWGGRYIWQLEASEELLVAWKILPDERVIPTESALITQFVSHFGARPFANLVNGHARLAPAVVPR